jgi:hypothetical protein
VHALGWASIDEVERSGACIPADGKENEETEEGTASPAHDWGRATARFRLPGAAPASSTGQLSHRKRAPAVQQQQRRLAGTGQQAAKPVPAALQSADASVPFEGQLVTPWLRLATSDGILRLPSSVR